MSKLTEIVEELIDARAKLVEASQAAVGALSDKSLPLEERWLAFTNLVKHKIFINEENYGDGELDMLGDNFTMYDNFNTERGQSLTYPEMYDVFIKWGTEEDWDDQDALAPEIIRAWQEKILEKGYSGFNHDW